MLAFGPGLGTVTTRSIALGLLAAAGGVLMVVAVFPKQRRRDRAHAAPAAS